MRVFSLFLIIFSFFAPIFGQNDKLEAWFSFDNCSVVDDSGNGSSGIPKNAKCDCGIGDSSYYFRNKGENIFLVGKFADIFSTSDFTVSFYFRSPDGLPQAGNQMIMNKQEDCNSPKAFLVRYNPKSKIIFSELRENDSTRVFVQGKLDDNVCWQYISLVRSNTRYSLYVNGILLDTKTSKGRIDLTSPSVFKISEPLCPLDGHFIGNIDELRFHSKALSPDEIDRYNFRADRILNSDTLIYLGNSFQLKTSTFCKVDYNWTPAAQFSDPSAAGPELEPLLAGPYAVQFTYYMDSTRRCFASDTIFVNVIDPDTLDCNKIFVPNAFTPGGSIGRNDLFGISNPFSVPDFISFEIYDRWGGRMFEAATQFDNWDGQFNGKPANPGVYLYRLRYRCNGQEKVKSGSLTLVR